MVNRWQHWCLNGCGKKVIYRGYGNYKNQNLLKPYVCEVCGKQFTRSELNEY